jgi:hypothetical protein
LLALLGNGFTSIIQKAEQIRFNGGYKNEFMMIAFIIIALVMVCISLIFERGRALQSIKRTVAFASLTGVASGIINLLIMVLTGLMAASVMFPAISAGGIVAAFPCLQLPIAPLAKAIPCHTGGVGGQQLPHTLEHTAAGQRHGREIEELPKPLTVDRGCDPFMGKQCLDLGRKIEMIPQTVVKKRLYAKSVTGKKHLLGGEVQSYLDHRIAMTGAVGLIASNMGGTIHGAECCAISFPDFFTQLKE